MTSARASAIAKKLRSALKLGEEELIATGSGNQFPLIPNLTEVNRRRNRRVLIRLERLSPDEEALDRLNKPSKLPAIVRSGSEERRPRNDGKFVLITEIPTTGAVEVY